MEDLSRGPLEAAQRWTSWRSGQEEDITPVEDGGQMRPNIEDVMSEGHLRPLRDVHGSASRTENYSELKQDGRINMKTHVFLLFCWFLCVSFIIKHVSALSK